MPRILRLVTALGALSLTIWLVHACSSDDGGGGTCQPAVAASCIQQNLYCASNGTCLQCPPGYLNCDGINANVCEKAGATCTGGDLCGGQVCNSPSCCYANACYTNGQPCGASGLTCNMGTCGNTPALCGGVTCNPPNCCYNGSICYSEGQICGTSDLTCTAGTCTNASVCQEALFNSCGTPNMHCVGTQCIPCTGTTKNCNGDNADDCECPNGCDTATPTSCVQTGTTPCGTLAHPCQTATQICVTYQDSGGDNFECKEVPAACQTNRTCACLAATHCPQWPGCSDDVSKNTIYCQE